MNMFKSIFKGNEYKFYRKNFQGGYNLEFPEMIINFILFIKKAGNDFDIESSNYFQHPDWKKFSSYLLECSEYYYKHSECTSFKMIIDIEKITHKKIWDGISQKEKDKIQVLSARFDNDNMFDKITK